MYQVGKAGTGGGGKRSRAENVESEHVVVAESGGCPKNAEKGPAVEAVAAERGAVERGEVVLMGGRAPIASRVPANVNVEPPADTGVGRLKKTRSGPVPA